MTEVENIDIDEIKVDSEQPRKTFPEDKIMELAESIKKHGILEPLIIDSKNKIVDGECRLRASKIVGLKKIPVIRLNPEDQIDRWVKQMVVNYHRIAQEPIDQAKILKEIQAKSAQTLHRDKEHKSDYHTKAIIELVEMTGISHQTISNRLSLLEAPEDIQKAVKEKKIKSTYVVEVEKSDDEEHKQELYEKIKKGEIKNRDEIRDEIKYKKLDDRVKEIESLPKPPELIIDEYFEKLSDAVSRLDSLLYMESNIVPALKDSQKHEIIQNFKHLHMKIMKFIENMKIDSVEAL